MAPKKSSTERNNLQTFVDLRKDFRKAFTSGVLRAVDIAPRIQDMVTAATNAIFEDRRKRTISSILSQLFSGFNLNPFGIAEALTFLWVYVGTAEEVVRRTGEPIVCTDVINGQLRNIFKRAVSQDKEKNLPHVAYLWRKVRQCYPPESEYPSHAKLFKLPDHPVDLDVGKTRDRIIEKFFVEMSSFPARGRNSLDDEEEEMYDTWAAYRNAVKKKQAKISCGERDQDDKSIVPAVTPGNVETASTSKQRRPRSGSDLVQEIGRPSNNNNNVPLKKSVNKGSLLFLTNPDQQKVAPVKPTFCREKDDKSIVTAVKPENMGTASTSKQQGSSSCVQKISNSKKSAANRPMITMDNDFLLFLTNPGEYVRMNPSLFPSNDANWSARKVLPDPPRKRNKLNNPGDDDSSVPELAQQIPADCTETMLRVDFTPEEYIDQTTASNYYAQGVKIVDGVRRVVFYHKMINPSSIKKEQI